MVIRKRSNRKDIEREILKRLFIERRNRIAHSEKINRRDIVEIRNIIRRLRKLR